MIFRKTGAHFSGSCSEGAKFAVDCGERGNPGLLAELESSGGSRAANADGAPRKHGFSIAGARENRKALRHDP
jgi:hypothetical protein